MEKNKKYLQYLKTFFGKKEQWLILLLVGILLVVIAIPVPKDGEEGQEVTQDEAREETSLSGSSDDEAYVRRLERRLEDALAQVQGVGKVSVMITLSASSEKIVEKDRETSSETTGENESGSSKRSSSSETSVYTGNGSDETPYITKELSPDIEGVLVIADGGDDAVVIENITEAVQALFPVDTHKIKVMKRNQ
ncbi:MAG: stage III sporulation protein AG [Bariatricus sp.]